MSDPGDPASGDLGVVLRTSPLRESDLLVTLYTETHGRVSAVARGGRKSQRRFAGTLSVLVLARYQLKRPTRGDLWGLDGGEVVREWTTLASDVVGVAHASYAIELLDAILPAEAPEPHALELLVSVWNSLVDGGPSPAALRAYELALLELTGQRPSLDACAVCGVGRGAEGGDHGLAIGAMFDPTRGGAICRRCAATSRGSGVRPLEPATREYLVAIAQQDSPGDARALDTDPRFAAADRAAARDAMLAMVAVVVGRPLKSLAYIAKLGAAQRRQGP